MLKTYDAKCYDLAEHFLADEAIVSTAEYERLANELACKIQDAVEVFMEYEIPEASRAS